MDEEGRTLGNKLRLIVEELQSFSIQNSCESCNALLRSCPLEYGISSDVNIMLRGKGIPSE